MFFKKLKFLFSYVCFKYSPGFTVSIQDFKKEAFPFVKFNKNRNILIFFRNICVDKIHSKKLSKLYVKSKKVGNLVFVIIIVPNVSCLIN